MRHTFMGIALSHASTHRCATREDMPVPEKDTFVQIQNTMRVGYNVYILSTLLSKYYRYIYNNFRLASLAQVLEKFYSSL